MLNRIAVSGGTYQDWVETVYTSSWNMHTETPMYEGGMSSEIEFQEVVSNSATADEPLGTLAGRGINTSKKGGKLHIKVKEPSYIMGIVSITPRVDYCQGNDFDMYFKYTERPAQTCVRWYRISRSINSTSNRMDKF